MTKWNRWVAAGIALALFMATPATAQKGQNATAVQAPVINDTGSLKGPRQPIFFRHDIHAGQDRIPCMYCHATAAVSSEPGMPSVQTCFGCHVMIGGSTPTHEIEIQKVRDAWGEKKPPQWVRIHALPAFVHFPHMRHIKALGTDACTTCHGDVQKMPQVHQVASLTMGWCVDCHVKNKVTRDCTVCHY
jgi:hypothetical protein